MAKSEPVTLSVEKHGALRLKPLQDYRLFKHLHLVPVVFQEFYGLATEFPLVFVRNSETGEFIPVAMMGLSQGKNLYCQTAQWEPVVLPSSFTLTPFSVQQLAENDADTVIGIDEDSPLLSESEGERLFDDEGNRSQLLQQRIDRVIEVTKQSLQARAVCAQLAEQKLLVTKPLKLQDNPQTPRYEVEGVYLIDEDALDKLDDEAFRALRSRGMLPIIYSHLTSLQQIRRLARKQFRFDAAERASATA